MIYVDIRAGLTPAERTPVLPLHLEGTWATLESCWKQDPHGRPDAVQLRVWLEVEMRRLQINDATPPASAKGAQPSLPSIGIEEEGDQKDPASSTMSGTSKAGQSLTLEAKSPLQSLSDSSSSTPERLLQEQAFLALLSSYVKKRQNPSSDQDTFLESRVPPPPSPPRASYRNSEGFSWTRTSAPSSNREFQPPPPPPRAQSLTYRQLLQQRLRKYQWQSTFSVDCSGPETEPLWKVSFFLGSTMIGESGWFKNKDAAKENGAMQGLVWLDTYGYH
jgi:hypothetical protein